MIFARNTKGMREPNLYFNTRTEHDGTVSRQQVNIIRPFTTWYHENASQSDIKECSPQVPNRIRGTTLENSFGVIDVVCDEKQKKSR